MMCSRLLKPHDAAPRLEARLVALHRPAASTGCAAATSALLHGSLNYLPVTAVFAAHRARQHLFPLRRRQDRTRAAGGPGRHHHACRPPRPTPRCSSGSCTRARSTRPSPSHPGDRPRVPARRARPVDRRHGAQALGRAQAQDRQRAAAGAAAGARRASPAPRVVAFQPPPLPGSIGPADPVRDQHHRAVRAPERRRAGVPAGGA